MLHRLPWSPAKWAAICNKAVNALYIKIQGTDTGAAKTDPLRKVFSPIVAAAAAK